MSDFIQPYPGNPNPSPQPPPPPTAVSIALLSGGDLANLGFNLYRANFIRFLSIMAPGYLIYFVLYVLTYVLPVSSLNVNISSTITQQLNSGNSNVSAAYLYSLLTSYLVSVVIALPVLVSSVAICVASANAYIGRSISFQQAYHPVLPMLGNLLLLAAVSELPGYALALAPGNTCLLGILELAYLFVTIMVLARLQVTRQALIFERLNTPTALNRSWTLIDTEMRGRAISVWFSLFIRTFLPLFVIGFVLVLVNRSTTVSLGVPIITALLGLLINPWFESTFTIFYLHLRGRDASFDAGTMLANLDPGVSDKKLVG